MTARSFLLFGWHLGWQKTFLKLGWRKCRKNPGLILTGAETMATEGWVFLHSKFSAVRA
jgi:hypothetical protein